MVMTDSFSPRTSRTDSDRILLRNLGRARTVMNFMRIQRDMRSSTRRVDRLQITRLHLISQLEINHSQVQLDVLQ